jgi:hypothetical protein
LPDPDFVFQRNEGGINEGWNSQHDGGTEGHTRRRVALMKGGTMTASGNTVNGGTMTARGSTAAGGTTETTTARGGMARGQRQGTAWQQGAVQLSRRRHRRWHKENGGGIAHGPLCWLRKWDQRGVCVYVSGLRLRLGYCKCMRYQSLVPSR